MADPAPGNASSVPAAEGGAAESVFPTDPHTDVRALHTLEYQSGFGAEFSSECLPGALPVGQNSPQICPYGLYAEQLSGTAFTVPRARNARSWLYRIRPSVMHERFMPMEHAGIASTFGEDAADPNQMRWFPYPLPAADSGLDFVSGITMMAASGDATLKAGLAIHMYACVRDMVDTAMQNSDGDFLIVPQVGVLHIQTECGFLRVAPKEIVVIPRGMRFRVCIDEPSRGYICEIYGGHFTLPELGPIGANGLANARDFLYPVAAYEDREVDYLVVNKYGGRMYSSMQYHSPFDVVAWHGNYAPYKYDLERFCTMNSVSFDHPDPSIYTVLTCATDTPGVALCDFVIFPPRWMVMDHSFRPPYYHRNCMSEFMGMIWGKYDAKVGFQPGGASLHSCCSPHGPDGPTFTAASGATLAPDYFKGGLAFMFETNLILKLTTAAREAPHRDVEYTKCWRTLPRVFNPAVRDVTARMIADAYSGARPAAPHVPSSGIARGRVRGDGTSALLHAASAEDGPAAHAGSKRRREEGGAAAGASS